MAPPRILTKAVVANARRRRQQQRQQHSRWARLPVRLYSSCFRRCLSSSSSSSQSPPSRSNNNNKSQTMTADDPKAAAADDDHWNSDRINAFVGHSFPDFIEGWDRAMFRKVGYGLGGVTAATAMAGGLASSSSMTDISLFLPTAFLGTVTAAYWYIGWNDMRQTSHAVRRNYPVLGNMRYIFETIRPELHQYFVESDRDGRPFPRWERAQIYQRAKHVNDTIPFGTRRNVYETHHEWACHSLWPKDVIVDDDDDDGESATRTLVGTAEFGTTQPYSASVLNISAMSYGALSDHAILALNRGAKLGNFSHNTGEGGVSRFHREGGADLVWNIGTGYFGCGSGTDRRVFEAFQFQETVEECNGRIKMVELKLSQGAKPGHGGLLPKAKINQAVADARKLPFPAVADCHSPACHSAFSTATEMMEFIATLRETAGGIPVGIKLCAGQPGDIAQLCRAMVEVGTGPDFITVDGAEGGTGAAPPELTNSVGLPLEEGLVLVRNMLVGAGLRDKVRLNASGKISSGFSLIRTLALGADLTCAARAFMLSLGCIQALKCNTNKCPTGVATQDPELMHGLDPHDKTHRVYHYHKATVEAAASMAGIMGYDRIAHVTANDIMRRIRSNQVRTLAEHFPEVQEPGCLLRGTGPTRLQESWDECDDLSTLSHKRWIY